jgi:hypothetical protein
MQEQAVDGPVEHGRYAPLLAAVQIGRSASERPGALFLPLKPTFTRRFPPCRPIDPLKVAFSPAGSTDSINRLHVSEAAAPQMCCYSAAAGQAVYVQGSSHGSSSCDILIPSMGRYFHWNRSNGTSKDPRARASEMSLAQRNRRGLRSSRLRQRRRVQ